MKLRVTLTALVIATLSLAGHSAQAATLLVTYQGDSGFNDFSFEIDSNPTPDASAAIGFSFFNYPIVTDSGASVATYIDFYNTAVETNYNFILSGTDGTYIFADGAQLYTGPESSPTIQTGVYLLQDLSFNSTGTLSISEVTGAVPEPSTWAMMLMGFGAMGWSFKRRRKLALA